MHHKQRLNKLEKELEKHTGGKIDKVDKLQVLHFRTEEEAECKVKNRMAELLYKYPLAFKEDFTFILVRNFDTREDYDR